MSLTSGELELLAEDILGHRGISTNLYCAECGYCLRTLPYAGRCPECGSEYNARALWKEGVFTAGMLEFPAGDVLATIVLLVLSASFIGWGVAISSGGPVAVGLVLLVFGAVYLGLAWKRTARYFRFRAIAKRIEDSEDG
jgi:hypothetical protein